MDQRAWQAVVHRVAQTQLKRLGTAQHARHCSRRWDWEGERKTELIPTSVEEIA